MFENKISEKIIGCAIEVHKIIGGPGLLESVYEEALCHELTLQGLSYQRQVPINLNYKGLSIKNNFFIDVLVENAIIIEVKSTEKHNPVFESQLLTYLRMTKLRLGLLINFGLPLLTSGVYRVINGY